MAFALNSFAFVQHVLACHYPLLEFGPNHGAGRGAGGVGGSRSSTPGSGDPQAVVSSSSTGTTAPATAPSTSKVESSMLASEDCRYFIMRCTNQKMVDISEAKGIWATSINNEAKLNRAFQVCLVMRENFLSDPFLGATELLYWVKVKKKMFIRVLNNCCQK